MHDFDTLKIQAAQAAVDLIEDGMVVGLGSGSTANYAINILGKKVAQGLNVIAIPTSEETYRLAKKIGIPLTTFAKQSTIDITIDGADQVEIKSLNLIKGLGNALLGEKIVASVTKKLVIMVDESKLVDRLGNKTPLPVEVVRFGWEITKEKILHFGCKADLKVNLDGEAIITDNGNFLLNCQFENMMEPKKLDKDLKLIIGVVETGLFIEMAESVIVAKQNGIVVLKRSK